VKALQQPQLRRRAVLDAYVREATVDLATKALGEEARAVVGDQKRRLRQRPVNALGLTARQIQRHADWSRSASSAFSHSSSRSRRESVPRPASCARPPLMNSSRQRHSVCSDTPARRAICTARSSLPSNRKTSCVRSAALNSDFLGISDLVEM
jgi:hypothetical protein